MQLSRLEVRGRAPAFARRFSSFCKFRCLSVLAVFLVPWVFPASGVASGTKPSRVCPKRVYGPMLPGCPDHEPFKQEDRGDDSASHGPTASTGPATTTAPVTRPTGADKEAKEKTKEPSFDWVTFTTRKGTWMHLDLSPDGKQIVFDLLGDLYLLPIAGGEAKPLTQGPEYDVHPRWSPDGKSIVFTSDRSGGNDTWIIDVQTQKMRQVTQTKWISANMAIWSPDGQYVVHRKRITDRRSVGVVELWKYHIWGGGGVRLTDSRKIPDANDPAFSPDGRYIYFASRGRHRYNRNPHQGIWTVQRLDLQTQKQIVISRNASCPTPSPDGKTLAIVRRVGSKTAILLHDLRTGEERLLVDNLDRDQVEGFAVNGTYPSFSWTSDSKHLVYSAQGHFWKVAVQTGQKAAIRFSAQVRQKVTQALRLTHRINQKHFYPRILRWVKLHPGGRFVVWNALGQTWIANWPGAKNPRRLLPGEALHYAPSFSHDGKFITYVTWSDTQRGHVWVRPFQADGTVGKARRVTPLPGYYNNPALSRDNKHLVYTRGSGSEARGLPNVYQPWLQIMHVDLTTGQHNSVATVGSTGTLGRMPHPQFSRDGKRVYFTRRQNRGIRSYSILCSARLDGSEERKHLSIYAAEDMVVSPDQSWLLFRQLHQVYVTILPTGQSEPVALNIPDGRLGGSRLPVMQLSTTSGSWPQWGPGGLLTWSFGYHFYTLPWSQVRAEFQRKASERGQKKKKKVVKPKKRKKATSRPKPPKPPRPFPPKPPKPPKPPVQDRPAPGQPQQADANAPKASTQPTNAKAATQPTTTSTQAAGKKKKKPRLQPTETKLLLKTPVARAGGCVALTDLRLVTMKGAEVIAQGTVVVEDGKIVQVGPLNKVEIPKGCRILRLPGKTATPGFVDVHAHLHYKTLPIFPENHWEHYVNLAYGVTTVFDPSAPTEFVFEVGERIRAGLTSGPHVFSTGFILYGAENTHKAIVHSLKQARLHLKRMKQLGAIAVKSYMQPTRQQRQWVMQAAREEKILVMPEGGGNLSMNLTMILDGHTGIEHALPVTPLYRDVIQLFARSKTGYTPTLLVAYGGIAGEIFFFQNRPIWNDPKLKQFFPPRLLAARGRRTSIHVHDNDWNHQRVAKYANAIVQAGGQVQIGSHGQLQGLGYHWELLALRQGGMSNHHVLRAATLHGARYIGLHKDIGSLEPGKLADIAIFDNNPLQDLKYLESIRWVMKQGFLYNARNMNRTYPSAKPRPVFPWHSRPIGR